MSKPIIDMPSKEDFAMLANLTDEQLQKDLSKVDLKKLINSIKWLENIDLQDSKHIIEDISDIEDLDKKAYPNYDYGMNIPGARDLSKWMSAAKDIYAKSQNGMAKNVALLQTTYNWNEVERFDFINWMKFYSSNDHLKYKTAQTWYQGDSPGYFLKVNPKSDVDETDEQQSTSEEITPYEKKQIIEKQRAKIFNRLNSIEKLITSPEGHIFARNELTNLLESIHKLKRQFLDVNIVNAKSKFYEDLIIREANILNKNGFEIASEFLYTFSQDAIAAIPASDPIANTGTPGGLPSTGPGMPTNPLDNPGGDGNEDALITEDSEGMDEFLNNLTTGGKAFSLKDKKDQLEIDDELEVDDLFSTAQEIPTTTVQNPIAPKIIEEPLEVSEHTKSTEGQFDNAIDSALKNITVGDVVVKLEDLAKIFKVREIPRQLAMIDMMLDALDLSSYFSELSEAINKSLESNNYISTRIEEVLSKLRGSMKGKSIDLSGDSNIKANPEIEPIKTNLKNQEDKDKARKQQRKEIAEEKSINNPEENIEIAEDLAQPIQKNIEKTMPEQTKQSII